MEIKALDLLTALKFVMTCAGKNDVHYYLNGVAFDMTQGSLTICATDGHRGAYVETKIAAKLKEVVIVERESIERLIKLIGKRDTVSIVFRKDRTTAVVDGDTVRLNLIDAKYPNWRKAFMSSSDLVATERFAINAKYLGQAAKACELFNGRYPGTSVLMRDASSVVTFKPSLNQDKFQDIKDVACVVMPLRE